MLTLSVQTPQCQPPRLTTRELHVLGLFASGASYKDVAMKLQISERGVAPTASRIISKLGAKNMVNAVHIAHQAGMINRPRQRPAWAPTSLDLLHSLVASGFSNRLLASTLETHEGYLSNLIHGNVPISGEMENRILRTFLTLHDQDPEKHGIHPRTISRARNSGATHGWQVLDLAEVRIITRDDRSAK